MTLPALTKTWEFALNQPILARPSPTGFANGGTLQRLMRALKDTLKGWGWVVKGSVGASSGGMDSVDRWAADSDLLWGLPGTDAVTSWIVLEWVGAAGAGRDLELLVWLRSAVAGRRATEVAAYLSYAGFTGGTTTARPTATDELQVRGTGTTPAPWTSLAAAPTRNPNCRLHALRSTDGAIQRVVAAADGAALFYFAVERAATPVAGWTHPLTWAWVPDPTYAALHATPAVWAYDAGAPAGWMALHLTAPVAGGSAVGASIPIANSVDGEPFLSSVGLLCASGKPGRHGAVCDAWFAPQGAQLGDAFPAGGAQLVVVGNLVIPWDGLSPLRS